MPRLHMSAATLTTLVTALSCRSPDALPVARPEPTRSRDGGPADGSGRARALEAPDAAPARPLGLVVDHPTDLELASLRGPRRPASCVRVDGPAAASIPSNYGGWAVDERCDGAHFIRYEMTSDELGASTSQRSFGTRADGSWTCETITTPCLSLQRVLRTRQSEDGSFLEFTCHTTRRRVDHGGPARVGWPCDEGDRPTPPPLYVRLVRRD